MPPWWCDDSRCQASLNDALASGVRVYAFNGAPVSVKSLKKGMDIGYSTAQDASGQSTVANIVILLGN